MLQRDRWSWLKAVGVMERRRYRVYGKRRDRSFARNTLDWSTFFCVSLYTSHCPFRFLFNKTNRLNNFFLIYFCQETTCFGQFLCPSSGVFHRTFGTGICHASLMADFKYDPFLPQIHGTVYHEDLLNYCRTGNVFWCSRFKSNLRIG
jgi:hypothetical protein